MALKASLVKKALCPVKKYIREGYFASHNCEPSLEAGSFQPAHWHRSAGVWQYPAQQMLEPLEPPRQHQINTQWNLYIMVHNIEKLSKTNLGYQSAQ